MTQQHYPRLDQTLYTQKLPNGMTVFVLPKPGFTQTYAFAAVNYGAIDLRCRRAGQLVTMPAGVAHYLEHKMFDLPDGDAMHRFARTGASPNAFTSYAMTAYHFSCTEQFEQNLALLLEMVTTPCFTAASVEKERGIIAQEIRMYEDSAEQCAFEQLVQALYAAHPIRVPIAGTVESIQAITPEMLYDCHAAFYDPSNLALCVVGDVEPERVAELAQAHSPAGSGKAAVRDLECETNPNAAAARAVRRMEVAMPTFSIGFKADVPATGAETFRTELVAELATEILAGEASPLYADLYAAGKIDGDFAIGYDSAPGAALITADGDSEDPEGILRAILDEADRLQREGIDAARFARLKKSAFGRRLRALDSFSSISYRIAACFFNGSDYLSFPQLYDSITEDDVAQFLRRTVRPERAALSVVFPVGQGEGA